MTLNVIIALILHFSPNVLALLVSYITVVEDRPMMSVKYCSQLRSSTFHNN